MTKVSNGLVHTTHQYPRFRPEEIHDNPFIKLAPDQTIAVIPSFTLESGVVLHNVPVAYKTYGTLAPQADNALVICHALTGSADVRDWWGPLLGGPAEDGKEARAMDISRFFIVCVNSLGSPYGSASPVTAKDGDRKKGNYGPEFPLTTIRDDVRISKLILDDLGVKQVAAVVGGSMGGMLTLEYAFFGKDYVRTIVAIATSARYGAWGISWGEAQRQSIYSDPKYDDGYYPYNDPPSAGLGAARMAALLTYRTRDSFQARFGRNTPEIAQKHRNGTTEESNGEPHHEHFMIHNEGHKNAGTPRPSRQGSLSVLPTPDASPKASLDALNANSPTIVHVQPVRREKKVSTYYSAQSYLRYQGQKFISRFDANCYIAISRKMDTHDISRGRTDHLSISIEEQGREALKMIEQPALILGIQSDGLFNYTEQEELAASIPNSELKTIISPDGHDAFLLEFRQVNAFLKTFLDRELAHIMAREPVNWPPKEEADAEVKESMFGEAEAEDITAW